MDRVIAYRREYAQIAGSAAGGLFLAQIIYWSGNEETLKRSGWFYKSGVDWTEETGLTRREQESARQALMDAGVLTVEKKGVPCRLWFKLDQERLAELLPPVVTVVQDVQTSVSDVAVQFVQSDKLVSTAVANKFVTSDKQDCDNEQTSVSDVTNINRSIDHVIDHSIKDGIEHTNGSSASAPTSGLRDRLALLAPDVGWPSFKEWWADVWLIYPKQGRVDKSAAERIARGISPTDWRRVHKAVQHYVLSSIVLRGKVRNAVNFFADNNWQPYEDGPIIDQPNGHSPTAGDAKATAQIGIMAAAAKQRAEMEAQRKERLNGNGHRPIQAGPEPRQRLT